MRISDWSSDVCSSDLEPFGRIARTILQLEYLDGALSLIFVERRRAAQPRPVEHFSKLDRVLERELSPRPDREVSGMSAVAEQDDLVVRRSDESRVGKEWVSTCRLRRAQNH